MKFLTFERLVGLSSLFIAACAAFFSIIGIGMLFSGSAIAAMTMACSLELGKLVATSFLYRYWSKTKHFLKIYLSLSVIILMIITSLGIFGYLSSAYQTSSIQNQLIEQKIQVINDQKRTIQDGMSSAKTRIATVIQLRNNQESRLSQSMTNIMIVRNPIQMRQIQQQTQDLIDQSEKNIEQENNKIQKSIDELQKLDREVSVLRMESGSKKDIQTFKFVADEFGVGINKIVKWFIIALISVFDPLAICLLLAYNTAISTQTTEKQVNQKDLKISPQTISTTGSISENLSVTDSLITTSSEPPIIESVNPPDKPSKIYPFSF